MLHLVIVTRDTTRPFFLLPVKTKMQFPFLESTINSFKKSAKIWATEGAVGYIYIYNLFRERERERKKKRERENKKKHGIVERERGEREREKKKREREKRKKR